MAKTKGPLFSEAAHGTTANLLTFSKKKTVNICRYQRKQKDAQSAAQIAQRAKYQDGITAWKALTDEEKAEYTAAGAAVGLSGYNYFLKEYLLTPPTPPTPNPYLMLLCHFDGANGQQSYTSDDEAARIATFYSAAQLVTASPKFGTASLSPGGSSGGIYFQNSSDFILGQNNFTMDMWLKVATSTQTGDILVHFPGEAPYWSLYKGTNYISFDAKISPSTRCAFHVPFTPTADTWYHVAVVRSGIATASDWNLYINGVAGEKTIYGSTYGITIPSISASLKVGASDIMGPFAGGIDELRFLNGQAAWLSDFTPFTRAYTIYD